MALRPSKIDYITHSWDFFTGCDNWRDPGICGGGTDYKCWAKGLIEGRLKRFYPAGFTPTFHPERFLDPLHRIKPARIGVCLKADLFADGISPGQVVMTKHGEGTYTGNILRETVFNIIEQCPQHQFLFLTKCPWNLRYWNPWPENAWVGASATDVATFTNAAMCLGDVQADIKFLSLEPLLRWGDFPADELALDQWAKGLRLYGIRWLIIGMARGKPPRIKWVREIVKAAQRDGVPVFLKMNLQPMFLKEAVGKRHQYLYPDWAGKTVPWGRPILQEYPVGAP